MYRRTIGLERFFFIPNENISHFVDPKEGTFVAGNFARAHESKV